MNAPETATSVFADIEIAAPVATAFRVFTEHFDRIKPREHNLLAVPIAETVFQTHVGGHVYDRGVDGSECRWARVLALDPPHRVVISWDISPRWQLEPDPARASEVEVRFVELGPEHTRVEIAHRHIDRHGDGWQGEAAALAADDAWPLYLRRFADVVAGVGVSPR
jgi:uncharacterized protein YndB with AHSA1/START domain